MCSVLIGRIRLRLYDLQTAVNHGQGGDLSNLRQREIMPWEINLTCFCGVDWFCELPSAAQRVPFVGFFGWLVPY